VTGNAHNKAASAKRAACATDGRATDNVFYRKPQQPARYEAGWAFRVSTGRKKVRRFYLKGCHVDWLLERSAASITLLPNSHIVGQHL